MTTIALIRTLTNTTLIVQSFMTLFNLVFATRWLGFHSHLFPPTALSLALFLLYFYHSLFLSLSIFFSDPWHIKPQNGQASSLLINSLQWQIPPAHRDHYLQDPMFHAISNATTTLRHHTTASPLQYSAAQKKVLGSIKSYFTAINITF